MLKFSLKFYSRSRRGAGEGGVGTHVIAPLFPLLSPPSSFPPLEKVSFPQRQPNGTKNILNYYRREWHDGAMAMTMTEARGVCAFS